MKNILCKFVLLLSLFGFSLPMHAMVSISIPQNGGFYISGGLGAGLSSYDTHWNDGSNHYRATGIAELGLGYQFSRENWQDIHYALGIRDYGMITSARSYALLVPMLELTVSKPLTSKLSVNGFVGSSLIFSNEIGVGMDYHLTSHLALTSRLAYLMGWVPLYFKGGDRETWMFGNGNFGGSTENIFAATVGLRYVF